jgi:integrase
MQGVGLHSLRHSYGSHLLSEGIPLAAVSKLLGHSTVYTTANVYTHALSKDEAAAAGAWDEIARKAKLSVVG